MLPATARTTPRVPSQLDGQRAPAPTQKDFETFCELFKKRDDPAALEQLGRQPGLATLTGQKGLTALHWAATTGCGSPVIEALLRAGAKPNATSNYEGYTALMLAAAYGQRCGIDPLLRAGANPNATDDDGSTALMRAATYGHHDTIDTLLRAGAHPNATDNYGCTALSWAATYGHRDAVDALQLAYARRGLALSDVDKRALQEANIPLLTPAQVQAARATPDPQQHAGPATQTPAQTVTPPAAPNDRATASPPPPHPISAPAKQAEPHSVVPPLTAERDQAAQAHQQPLVRAERLEQEAAEQTTQHQQREAQHATDLKHKTRELESLRQQHADLTGNLAEAQARNQAHAIDLNRLRADIAALTQRDKAREAELVAVRTEIGTLRASNTTLERQAKQTLTERDTLHQDHDRLQSRHEEQTKTLADTHVQLTETLARIHARDAENAKLRGTADQLTAERDTLAHQLADALRQLALWQTQAAERETTWQQQITQWHSQKSTLEQRLQDLQSLRAEQQQHLAQDHANLQALQGALVDTESRFRKTQHDLDTVQAELARHAQSANQSARDYQALLARQTQLEQDKAALQQQKDDWQQRHDNLQIRIRLLEDEQQQLLARVPQADALPAQQAGLVQQRTDLDAKRARLQNQQDSPARQQQLQKLDNDEKGWREQAERLDKQLRLFEQHGVPPLERALNTFLKELKRSPLLNQKPPEVFISYAWEDTSTSAGRAANEKLQGQLLRLQRYLGKLGATAWLDLSNIHGNLANYMETKLAASRYVLLIGTPRLQTRIAHQPNSNVAFEFSRIQAKSAADPTCLIPLMLDGDYGTAFPPGVTNHLVHDLREDSAWPRKLAQLAGPGENAGLIPTLYGLTSAGHRTPAFKAYEPAWLRLQRGLADIEHR